MSTDTRSSRGRRASSHRPISATPGDVLRRSYVRRPACVRQGSAFAAAAVLAAHGPDDWQVSQDVADAAVDMLARCLRETDADATELCVEIRLAHPIELTVSTETGWSMSRRVQRQFPPRG